LHCHYFGSYHAEGTPNPNGGTGNEANVKRALELDMGVFNISPIDKGGLLQNPSATIVRTIGHKLSPIAFALLANNELGFHTSSVGFGRPTDMDEAVDGASLHENEEVKTEFEAAVARLESLKKEKLGEEWCEKGYLNIPDFYDETTGGTAIGHILWCHNVITAFGMYKFAKLRYGSLEKTRGGFKSKKSFEENIKAMDDGNPGLSFDPDFDYTEALAKHYNPSLALEKMKEVHSWLKKDAIFSEEEIKERGWDSAYDLQTWEIFPGGEVTISQVLLQNVSRGRYGISSKSPDERKDWVATVKNTKDAYEKVLGA